MIGMQYFVPSVVSDMVAVLPFDVKLIYRPLSNFRHWVDFDWINLDGWYVTEDLFHVQHK